MQFYNAKVPDILRLHQRDDVFLQEIENKLHSILKHNNGARLYYYKHQNYVPVLTRIWYYFMTSMANLQTLGEEYTGTIRLESHDNKLPNKIRTLLWLILYVGGDSIVTRCLKRCENEIRMSSSLTNEARSVLLNILIFFKNNKELFQRIHQSLFYIDAKYQFISMRIAKLRYAMLRQWMQDDSYSYSFRLLGKLSLFYVLFMFVQQFNKSSVDNSITNMPYNDEMSSSYNKKVCVLCSEPLKNPCATPCGHIFCWDCIFDSLSYQKLCPLCREHVTTNRLIHLQNFT